MATKRIYTDADRARVKAALDSNGGNVKRTARETGLPVMTVRTWKQKWEREGLPAEVEAALPAIIEGEVEDIDRVRNKYLAILEEKADRRDVTTRDAITAYGVLTDKSRLMQGKPTSRTEHDGGAGSLPVDQVREMFAGFARGIVEAAAQRDAAISSANQEEPIEAEWTEQAPLALVPSA